MHLRTEVILHEENGDARVYTMAMAHESPPAIVLNEDGRPYLLSDDSERDPRGDWVYVEPSWSKVKFARHVVGPKVTT